MKKFTLFLAAMALCAGSVFAASSFSGKARIRLGMFQKWNGTENVITFGLADKADTTFKFFLVEEIKSKAGEGGVYGEVSALAQLRFKKYQHRTLDFNWYDINTLPLKYQFGFNYANLVFDKEKNFKLGIQGINPVQRYARGWEIEVDNGNTIATTPFFTYGTVFENTDETVARARGGWMPAMTLTYDKVALTIGLDGGYGGSGDEDHINGLALFQANDVVVSDGLRMSGNIGYFNSFAMKMGAVSLAHQSHLLYGLKFDYVGEDMSLVIGATGNWNVAKDSETANFTDVDDKNAIEASLNFDYRGDIKASADVWFLDNQALWSDDDEPDEVTYDNPADLGFVYRDKDGNFLTNNNTTLHKALSARIMVNPVPMLGVTLRAQDVLNQGIYGIDVPVWLSRSFKITPSFEYTVDTEKTYNQDTNKWENAGDANDIIEGNLAFNYYDPMFNLYAYCRFGQESDNDTTGFYFRPYLDVTSKTLINGARLSLRWQKATFTTKSDNHTSLSGKYHNGSAFGEIYLEARIDF